MAPAQEKFLIAAFQIPLRNMHIMAVSVSDICDNTKLAREMSLLGTVNYLYLFLLLHSIMLYFFLQAIMKLPVFTTREWFSRFTGKCHSSCRSRIVDTLWNCRDQCCWAGRILCGSDW
jgi:hypothetical protein